MKRFPWNILFAFLVGLGIGLAYAWIIAPQHLVDSEPGTLRVDFKDQFRELIAASFAATGNLPRALARLEILSNENPVESLNAQAQREIANGQFTQADQLAALASVLENGTNFPPQSAPTNNVLVEVTSEPSITPFPSPADIPLAITETLESIETQSSTPHPIPNTATPRPTRTTLPTQGPPFQLTGLDTICDPNLPDNLLQVIVYNANRRQLAGIKVIVTWDSGEEEFYTGLKPELGNGYADFTMTAGTFYTVQLGLGSEISTDITSPTCQAENGETYLGGYKAIFQQP